MPYEREDVNKIKSYKHWGFGFNNNNFLDNFSNDSLKSDKLFALMALNSHSMNYKFLSESLKEDKQIIKNAVFSNGNAQYNCLEYLPLKYKDDKKFMTFYIKCDGRNINFVSNKLKKDLELTYLAINTTPYAVEFIDNEYKDNEKLICRLLNKNIRCFEYISERLRNDKKIIIKCIKILQSLSIKKSSEFDKTFEFEAAILLRYTSPINRSDKEIVLPLITLNGYALQYASNELKQNKEIVYAAISNCPESYIYADEKFFEDKDFLLLSLKNEDYDEENYEDFLQNLSDNFQDDKDIVMSAVKKCGINIKYASSRLKNDKDIVMAAINSCYYNDDDSKMKTEELLKYIKKINKNIDIILEDTNLKNDSEILQQVIKKIKII